MADKEKEPALDPAHAFLMKEFELLRASVESAVGELRNLDRWVLVTTAAVWTWILTKHPAILRGAASVSVPEAASAILAPPWIVFFVPPFIVAIFFLKAFAINRTLDLTAAYLRDCVEARIGPEDESRQRLGFETYFFKERQKPWVQMALIRAWSYVYYSVLMIAYLLMAGWGMRALR